MNRRTVPPAGPRRERSGLTLVEVIISILMLAVSVMGLLGSAAAVSTQMGGGVRQTVAASIAESRIDSLTSLACAQLAVAGVASGTAMNRGIKESWSVTDGKNVKTIVVEITIPKRTKKLSYSTVIPCRD
ncbi:MAG: hypothetical protein V4617_15850 [Gemmatimonadota bacterium]